MYLSEAGSVASIVSLLITGWVVFEVRTLHIYYKRHLLLPQFVRELARHAKNARRSLEAKRTEELKGTLKKCDAILERVPRYADKPLAARAKRVRDSISSLLDNREHNILGYGHDVIDEIDATIQSAVAFTGEDKWSTRT